MRIFYYFCCKFLFIAAIVFIAVGCSDIIEIEHDKDIIGGNGKGLSVIEAKEFFEKSIMSKSRAEQEPKDDKYYKERCMLPVGDFVPQWEEGISTDAPTLFSVDVPIKATYRYRVLRIDEKTQKVYTTTCYQELVVVKDLEGRMGYKVVLFIPDREYSIKNPGDVSRRLTNGIDMGDYSGLKIYTDIEGRMTRVNRFLNGKKTVGIDLTTPGTFNERLALYVRALKTIGKISIQRQGSKAVMSRGEDDWYDDSWEDMWGSWWGDDYDDVSDANNDYYEYVDTQSGDDIYYNRLDGNFYIDFGGNGHIDSCISDEVVIQPGDEEGTTPPDDPIDDPEETPEDGYEWGDITDNSDIADSGDNGSGDNGDSGDDEKNKNINKEYTPKETDVIADNNLLKMDRKEQNGNTCVPTVMEYILKNNGSDLDRKDIIKYFENKLSKEDEKYDVVLDGVPSNAIPAGVVYFFGSDAIAGSQYGGDPPYNYKSAIDSGNVVMTNIFIEVDGDKIGHNILIVGYTKEGNYIYIDPNHSDKEFECSPDYIETKNASKYDFEFKKK